MSHGNGAREEPLQVHGRALHLPTACARFAVRHPRNYNSAHGSAYAPFPLPFPLSGQHAHELTMLPHLLWIKSRPCCMPNSAGRNQCNTGLTQVSSHSPNYRTVYFPVSSPYYSPTPGKPQIPAPKMMEVNSGARSCTNLSVKIQLWRLSLPAMQFAQTHESPPPAANTVQAPCIESTEQ